MISAIGIWISVLIIPFCVSRPREQRNIAQRSARGSKNFEICVNCEHCWICWICLFACLLAGDGMKNRMTSDGQPTRNWLKLNFLMTSGWLLSGGFLQVNFDLPYLDLETKRTPPPLRISVHPKKKIPKMVYNRCARCNLGNFQVFTLWPLLTI